MIPGEVVDTASVVILAATTIQQQQLGFVILHLVRHEALFRETFCTVNVRHEAFFVKYVDS